MMSTTILGSLENILSNSQTLYADIQNVIATVKDAEADGKITASEVLQILESIMKALGDITMSALDIKNKVS